MSTRVARLTSRSSRQSHALALSTFVVLSGAISSCAGCEGSPRETFNAPDAADAAPPSLVEAGSITACELAASRRSPLGCDYGVFAVPHGAGKLCAALLVSNPGTVPALLSVQSGGLAMDLAPSARLLTGKGKAPGWEPLVGNMLPPGASAVIALVDGGLSVGGDGHCPFAALDDGASFVTEEATRNALRVRSDQPIFASYYYNYATSAEGLVDSATGSTSLRAVSSWSSRYLDVGMYQPGRPAVQKDRTGSVPSTDMFAFAAVVAFDPTRVTLGTDGGVDSLLLKAGEVHRFIRDDLHIGTAVTADRPIGVFVGAGLAWMPYNVASGDQVMNQIAPVDQWAAEYAAVGHPARRPGADDAPLYRIIAERDDTVLEYDPARPAGAPTSLGAGGLGVFRSSSPFVVRSRDGAHRFFVSVAMTGGGPLCEVRDAGPDDPGAGGEGDVAYWHCPGDPELISVPPPSEYAFRFAFTTQHQYADTYLVLVRKKDDSGRYGEVTLDCAGKLEGWKAIDGQGTYETLTVPLSRGNFEPQVYPGGSCTLGAHTMSSDVPFTGFLWAWTHEGVDGLVEGDDGSGRSYGFAIYGTHASEDPAR